MDSLTDHYRINVAVKKRPEDEYGTHLFYATVRDEDQAKIVYKELRDRFHPNEYNITVTGWKTRGSTPGWV